MRIALVITELNPGGAERCLTELALYLAAYGHTVVVWTLGPLPDVPHDELLMRLRTARIDVRSLHSRGLRDACKAARLLRRELEKFAPDVVQSMLWHADVLCAWALRSHPAPLIGGIRVSEPRSIRWPVQRWASRRMYRVVCVSRDVAQHARQRQHIDAEKLVVIPNAVSERWLSVDAGEADWSKLGLSSDGPKLIFAGRLEPQKGIEPLGEHLLQLLSGIPDWSLVVMGEGRLRRRLQSQVESAGLEGRVHLVGWQPEAPEWMLASNILILPAQYEGMPNVILEAMAVARPFVAFAVDGVRELLDERQAYPAELAAAQLAEPGDWDAFIACIHRLASDPVLQRRCGQANRQHVARHFRLEPILSHYAQLYQQAVAELPHTAQLASRLQK